MVNQTIQQQETNPSFIEANLGQAAFGKNKLMYLPLIAGIGLLMFVLFVVFDGLIETVGLNVIIILSVIIVLCFISVKLIHNHSIKELKTNVKLAPICYTKKIYGNDSEDIHYCIYTTGDNRHDKEFINNIAQKIVAISPTTTDPDEKNVNKLFRPDDINMGAFAKPLPLAFTEGVVIWRRQFLLRGIENPDAGFWVVAINPENAKICKSVIE